MEIVAASALDAPALTALAMHAKAHWGYPAEWLHRWAPQLTITPEGIASQPTYLARNGPGPLGFYALAIEDGTAWLEHLWVAPAAMRHGVGRRLFAHAETTARARGCTCLRIVSDPHAEGFYCRMGATTVGQEDASIDGMERRLPILEKRVARAST